MLARAAAAGLDVGAIVNGLNQPLPLVRFQLLVQKAAEICQEVKSLGNNLLSAMEKEDNEALALLRAKHERVVMEMVEQVKYAQLQEAIKSKEGLLNRWPWRCSATPTTSGSWAKKPDEIEKAIPELGELDKDSLDKMKFAMRSRRWGCARSRWTSRRMLGASQAGRIAQQHEAHEEMELFENFERQRRTSATSRTS